MDQARVEEFAHELGRSFGGEIRLDRLTRLLYSTDASMYQIEPLAVLIPRTHDDVAAAVTLASLHRLPLLPRGGGTSLAGQTVGAAVVLDYSKHMNRILECDYEARTCRIQPGVVLDQLNGYLKGSGWQFGPDVSTSSRATLGGMMGNNSCGSHSILHGKTIDHVKEMRVLLSGGDEMRFAEVDTAGWEARAARGGREGELYRAVGRIAREQHAEIEARFPRVMRRVGGYNLDRFAGERRNLCEIVVGSEGTLATYTEALVRIVPAARHKGLDVLHFDDMIAAMEAMPAILELRPAAVELVDKMMLDLTRLQPAFARQMTFVEGEPEALLIVEFYGETPAEVGAHLQRLDAHLERRGFRGARVHAVTPEAQANVWSIRKAGLGLLSSIRGDSKPVAFVEDTAVEPSDLAGYVRRFYEILERHGARAGFYGHASVGCLHIRPLINLKDGTEVRKMSDIAAAVKDLVVEFRGAMSGEHGDGLVRSHWNRELFGPKLYEAFREVKRAFDPLGILNPGKIVESQPMTDNLRYGPSYAAAELHTHLDFSRDGGFSRAVEQCNGMGACRKVDSGTMCPSYMATREEEHSTRGRANALRAALTGRLPDDGLHSPRLYETLDLCLECKACKTECPAGVDMAKLKYEFLAHYHERHGTPVRSRVFARIAVLSRAGAATAPVSNWIVRSRLFRSTLQRALGIHPARKLPPFVRRRFRAGVRARLRPASGATPTVALFADTFTDYNEPRIGEATAALLESAGARVALPDVVCCGRPMISKGLLVEARAHAERNIALLDPLVQRGAVIVGCEPSCLLTLRDDYQDLVPTAEARRVAGSALLLEEYLVRELDGGRWRPRPPASGGKAWVHGHCHQKTLVGTAPSMRLLREAAHLDAREIDSGCCGMAGSFGYEREHYDLSMAIGEMRLFPAVRRAEDADTIVASGTSCRQQIEHGTGRRAYHLAEVLASRLDLR